MKALTSEEGINSSVIFTSLLQLRAISRSFLVFKLTKVEFVFQFNVIFLYFDILKLSHISDSFHSLDPSLPYKVQAYI